MTYGFALLTAGTLLVYSGWSNSSIVDVLRGLAVRKGGAGDTGFVSLLTAPAQGAAEAVKPGGEGLPAIPKGMKGNPTKRERELQRSNPELKPGIRTVAAIVLTRFPGLTITSTTGGTHADNSFHYKGRAVDIGGSQSEMDKAARWINRYLSKTLEEGIHNPGLSVKEKKHVSASFWGSETWGAHHDHIHLAV